MGKKVLLTGGTGFTGLYIKTQLEQDGFEVFPSSATPDLNKGIIYLNLLNLDSIEHCLKQVIPDYIIHLAAVAFVAHSNESDFYNTNTVGTLNLLEACHKILPNIKKIIIASSANIYGTPSEKIVHEEVLPSPVNHYAMSKLAMETLVINLYKGKLPILISRPFNYTGKLQSQNFLIPKIVNHFKQKKEIITLGNINITREFNDVRDISYCYSHLLSNKEAIGITNICSGQGYSLTDIINMCSYITNHKLKINIDEQLIRQNEISHLTGDPKYLKSLCPQIKFRSLEKTLLWMLDY
jgi:nucleoside-diphosphate-sugar epimerase